MRTLFVFALLIASYFIATSLADHVVYRPVYYYPADDDFDGIDGRYDPQVNPNYNFDTEGSGVALTISFATLLFTALLM